MFQLLITAIVIAVVTLLVMRGNATFKVIVKNGKVVDSKGSISGSMLDDFDRAVSKVRNGKIVGNKSSQGLKLSFNGDIDDFTQQRLRNIVGIHHR